MNPNSLRHLNRQQVGAYAEYYVKMQLTIHGFQVYSSEVDDRGIDFVARYKKSQFLEVQVKSSRTTKYIFMQKSKFDLDDSLYLALVLLSDGQEPDIYFIPSTRWATPDGMFVSKDYEGLKSNPEWGLYLSKKNTPILSEFRLTNLLEKIKENEALL